MKHSLYCLRAYYEAGGGLGGGAAAGEVAAAGVLSADDA